MSLAHVESFALPATLTLSVLSDEEQATATRLLAKLEDHQPKNALLTAYYEGAQRVRDLGIAIPPHLRDLEAVAGWPGMAVDVLDERLEHDGWHVPGDPGGLGVDEIVEANHLGVEFSGGHIEALIHGVAFGVAGAGGPGEPNPLVTVESPTVMTATWDRRRRAVSEALLISTDAKGETNGATLWVGATMLELSYEQGRWSIERRSTNRLGRPPVRPIVNRPRAGDYFGRSEITRGVRALTNNAVRTLVAMEVSRDFHAAPKFWLLGADESSFVGSDGKPKTAWETYIGRLNAISNDGDGNTPTIQQFAGASPAPFLEQLRGLAQMFAAESALPISYLGLVHDANPASADAALVAEARLNKRAERRQKSFGSAEGDLLRDAIWIRDGRDPGVTPRPDWRPAATPTLAAAADAATKLVSAGILPSDSEITQKRVGLTETDRDGLAAERRRMRAAETVEALGGLVSAEGDLKERAEAFKVLLDAGTDRAVAAQVVGLPDLA